tara:strand:- start:2803 stop:3171 length:369 start_codon:yes stop_codon:yes gene_type:complete
MALTDEQKKHFINQKKKIALKNKEYYEKNKETILEKRKIKKQLYLEQKGATVETPVETPIKPTTNKKQEHNSKYYNLNKQTILENKKKKLECKFCKSLVSKNDITRHYKSIKCMKVQEFIEV